MTCPVAVLLALAVAQDVDPNLEREVAAVRAELARSYDELLKYVWTEQVDVLVSGKPRSSNAAACGYDREGRIIRTPLQDNQKPGSKQTSNRPLVRSRGETQDYIERAISRIRDYVPPTPQVIDHLVRSGQATFQTPSGGTMSVRMTHYYQDGDSVLFTYDAVSKRLLRVNVSSNLVGNKDPVTLEAVFELLPGNVNHLATATLKAPNKKVQVNMKNLDYKKLVD